MKQSLLILLFFAALVSVAHAANENSGMEKEILRQLDQIQKIGVTKWNRVIIEKLDDIEKEKKESRNSMNVVSR